MGKLFAKHLDSLIKGLHNDGDGLYLAVRAEGTRAWVFRYRDRVTGKLRDKGLGRLTDVSLSEARKEAAKLRDGLRAGTDPIQAKRDALQAAKLAHARPRRSRTAGTPSSRRTRQAGATPSTASNGRTRSRNTPSPRSETSRLRKSAQRTCCAS